MDAQTRPSCESGAVVALKPTQFAKSRLGGLADPLRRRIAWSMAVDTLSTLATQVDQLLVVSDQPSLESRLSRLGLSVTVAAEPGPVGMNGALSYGEELLHERGCTTVVACVGDLPALGAASLQRILEASRSFPRSFVADASGVGTTMLLAHDTALQPHFQGRSAVAHRTSGAIALESEQLGGPVTDARSDVDTEGDLVNAFHLGLGQATRALFDPAVRALGRYQVITVSDRRNDAGEQLAITSDGARVALPEDVLQDGLRGVRTGQRLHAVTAADRILAAWL